MIIFVPLEYNSPCSAQFCSLFFNISVRSFCPFFMVGTLLWLMQLWDSRCPNDKMGFNFCSPNDKRFHSSTSSNLTSLWPLFFHAEVKGVEQPSVSPPAGVGPPTEAAGRGFVCTVGWGSRLYSFRVTPALGDNYSAYCLSQGAEHSSPGTPLPARSPQPEWSCPCRLR